MSFKPIRGDKDIYDLIPDHVLTEVKNLLAGGERKEVQVFRENGVFRVAAADFKCLSLGRFTKQEASAWIKERHVFTDFANEIRKIADNAADDDGIPVCLEVSDQEIIEKYERLCQRAVEWMERNGLITDEETKKRGAPIRVPAPTGNPVRDRIRNLRQRLGLPQSAMGELLGITQETIQGWESGAWKPSGPALKLLELMENGVLGNKQPTGEEKKKLAALYQRVADVQKEKNTLLRQLEEVGLQDVSESVRESLRCEIDELEAREAQLQEEWNAAFTGLPHRVQEYEKIPSHVYVNVFNQVKKSEA
jgi:putative transcriptional regulator